MYTQETKGQAAKKATGNGSAGKVKCSGGVAKDGSLQGLASLAAACCVSTAPSSAASLLPPRCSANLSPMLIATEMPASKDPPASNVTVALNK